jgi:hypothetical protein
MGALASAFSFPVAFGFLIFGALVGLGAAIWIPQSEGEFRAAVLRTARQPQQVSQASG